MATREKLQNAPGWTSERLEALAQDIYKWLVEHEMWVDICIYYDGKRMATNDGNNFRYNGEPFIEEDVDPRDYFEYVGDPHILSMSFEGPLYDLINYDGGHELEEFHNIFTKHSKDLYFEQGHAWNLSCYE